MDFGVALVAGSETAEVVQVSKAALDDPALAAEARPVGCPTTGDHGRDPKRPQQPPVLVMVITAVGEHTVGLLAWPSELPGHWPTVEILEQRDQLGDVVAVATGEGDRKRNAAGVDEQMML